MRITESARKHGVADEDRLHAITMAIRVVAHDYDDEIRSLVIGADRAGRLLELVVVDDDETAAPRIIHADVLRPKFYRYLDR
jgi:hypothetical protein